MSVRSKNIAVGLTVLVALLLLAVMVLLFAGAPEVLQGGYRIHARLADSGGAKIGDTVSMRGMSIGKVTEVSFAGSDPRQGVLITIHVDKGVKIPAGAKLYITRPLLGMGTTSVGIDTGSENVTAYLATDDSAVIQGEVVGLDISKAMDSLQSLAQSINNLLGAGPTSQGTTTQGTTKPGGNLQTAIVKLDETLGALNTIIGDKENQQNIKVTLSELKTFTANGSQAMDAIKNLALQAQVTAEEATKTVKTINNATTQASNDVSRLTQGLIRDAEDLSRAMTSLDKAINAMASGQGTTGKLITDPHLYNNLVDVADQMSAMLKETRELLQQWKEKGIPLKLK